MIYDFIFSDNYLFDVKLSFHFLKINIVSRKGVWKCTVEAKENIFLNAYQIL